MTQVEYIERVYRLLNACPEPWDEDKAADHVWELWCDLDHALARKELENAE